VLREVRAPPQRIQFFPPRPPVIAFAAADNSKSGPTIEPSCRLIIFLYFEEHGAHAATSEMAEMGQQQLARQTLAAMLGGDGNGKNFGLVRRDPRDREADAFGPQPQAMHQRIALAQHLLEFALAPAAMKRRAVKLGKTWRIAQVRGLDHCCGAAKQARQPSD